MLRRLLPLVLLAGPAALAQEADRQPLLYVVADADSRVYLLGSIHVLDEAAYPLPGYVEAAYADAEALAFEIDMTDAAAMSAAMEARAALPEGTTLESVLPAPVYARLDSTLGTMGIPIVAVSGFKPWAIQLTLAQLAMQQRGYTGQHGVDVHFLGRALEDEKEQLALETIESQLDLFDGLPADVQAAYLDETLREWDQIDALVDQLVTAWGSGDEATLDALMNDMPEAMRPALLRDRNEAWVPQIEAYLDRTDEDVLVVVGAGHLVGDESVVAMLREAGFVVTRLGTE